MSIAISGSSITFPDQTQMSTATGGSFRNRIINGDMRIDQRNVGASVTPSSTAYVLDRWSLVISGAASKLSIQQSTTVPDGYKNSTVATVVASYSPASNDVLVYQQAIEGFNFGDLAWGTSSAQAITISFWVRSSLIGTYSVMLLSNGTGGTYRNYIATYSISSANVWEKKTITVLGDTTGTWDTGNTTGLYLAFDLGSGSGTATTAGSWANGVARKSTGANTFVSQSNGATWYVTGVQLEQGSTATEFERRPIGTEIALCKRYYDKSYNISVAPATATRNGMVVINTEAWQNSWRAVGSAFKFSCEMRTAPPSITYYDGAGTSNRVTVLWNSATPVNGQNPTLAFDIGTSGVVTRQTGGVTNQGSIHVAHYTADAEL